MTKDEALDLLLQTAELVVSSEKTFALNRKLWVEEKRMDETHLRIADSVAGGFLIGIKLLEAVLKSYREAEGAE